jgi:hypothetical protein
MAAAQRFSIAIGPRSWGLLRLFGVRTQEDAMVMLADERLDARFGRGRITTPVANVASWRIEGPWHWITAIGIRSSLRHGDLTFGGNANGGIRIDFREPVRFGLLRPTALYLTVGDLEGFAAALAERGIPGADARRQPAP